MTTRALSIVHRVSIPAPRSHVLHVETTLSGDVPPELVLFMPVWSPGSYLVREYARHVEGVATEAPATLVKIRKNAWRLRPGDAGRAVVRYRVHAHELSVRTSHVDETHAFLAGAAVFLGIEGGEDVGARVVLDAPREWRVATSLPPSPDSGFLARDFHALVDSPIEVGTHREERFEACARPHRYAIWPPGAVGDADVKRLVADTRTIVETEARLFAGSLPYDAYDFLLRLSSRARGGLEHAASAALIVPATAFQTRDGYLDLLSLVAHELLHAWNVKRIVPAGLARLRYQEECYTRLLWWFEGATSYYDWRVLRTSRLCSVEEYLDHLAGEIAHVEQTPGRLVQSLEDASFDAWIKLYRPDENTVNTAISYYRKGEIVCAMLDVELRARSDGRASLDDVLALLWKEHGLTGTPVPEDGMPSIFERATGVDVRDRLDAWVRAPGEVDVAATLAKVGVRVERGPRSDAPSASLGARVRSEGGRTMVVSVLRDAAAWRGGIDSGDELLALGGVRIEGGSVEGALRGRAAGDEVDVLVGRDGRVLTRRVALDPPRHERVRLLADRDAPPAARARFAAWLGEPHPAWTHPGGPS
jgi:predicted metalloprotease with PDZ domain